MGTNNNKKCTVFLSFWRCSHPAAPGYNASCSVCQQPGRNIYRRLLPFSSELRHRSFPGAPGATQKYTDAPKKMADFREIRSLVTHSAAGPGLLKQDPSSTINGGLPGDSEIWRLEFPGARCGPRANLSTGYPATYCRGSLGV